MKKHITLLCLMLLSIGSYGQSWINNGLKIYYNSGNVGIGTTSPTMKLDVRGSLKLLTNGTSRATGHFYAQGSGEAGLYFDASNGDGVGSDYGSLLQKDDLSVHLNNYGNNPIHLRTANADRLTILGNGDVGIGTISPTYKLTINTSNENHFRFENGNESAFLRLRDDGDLNIWAHGDDALIFSRGTGAGTESMRITSSGQLGIGTISPFGNLEVSDSGDAQLQITSSGNFGNAELSFLNSFDNYGFKQFLWNGGEQLHFNYGAEFNGGVNATANIMTLHGNGNVGIGTGTTSPSAKLHVEGSGVSLVDATYQQRIKGTGTKAGLNISHSGNGGIIGYANLGSGGLSNTFYITTGSAKIGDEGFVMDGNGNVGINTLSPGEKLEVNGNALIDGELYSKKVKVSVNPGNWPDYVFASSYELRALSEVEDFVKKNGHLPEVPSAEKIEKEGLDLGDMDATLLKKVEELTLYVLELEAGRKKLEDGRRRLEVENSELKKNNQSLEKRLSKIEEFIKTLKNNKP